MIVSLRHLLGWMVSAFRSREGLVLENLALRQQPASSARETTSPPIDCPAQAVLGRIEDVVVLGDYFRVADDPMTIMQFFGEMLARHLWYSSGT